MAWLIRIHALPVNLLVLFTERWDFFPSFHFPSRFYIFCFSKVLCLWLLFTLKHVLQCATQMKNKVCRGWDERLTVKFDARLTVVCWGTDERLTIKFDEVEPRGKAAQLQSDPLKGGLGPDACGLIGGYLSVKEMKIRRESGFMFLLFPRHHFDTHQRIWARPSSSLATKHTHLPVLLFSFALSVVSWYFPGLKLIELSALMWGCTESNNLKESGRKGGRKRGGKTAHNSLTFDP